MPLRSPIPEQGRPLHSLESSLQAALDQVLEAIVLVDAANGQILHANHLFTETFASPRAALPGVRLGDLFEADEAHADFMAAVDQACRGTGWMGRAILKTRSGARVRFEGALCPVRPDSGEVASVVVRLKDLTLEVERDRNLQLAQKMSALGTLAGGVAHDFNNLVCAVLAAAEQIEQHLEAESPIRRKLAIIQQAGSRAQGLTAQILNFGRRSQEAWSDLDFSALLTEAAGLLRATAPPNVEIVTDLPPGIQVLGDPSQLHQVVMNLGINASQAMQPQGGTLLLQVRRMPSDPLAADRYQQEPCVELLVEDTGCGMDPTTLERIFEPFFTTKGEGRGTGLGLAVVHDIIQGHGGLLQVSSTPGKGSAFHVFFPQLRGRRRPLPTIGPPSQLSFPGRSERTAGD